MTAAQMTDTAAIGRFLFDHNHSAVFSLVSMRTGSRFTYKVSRHRTARVPLFFVFVLTGPENTSDYQFLGSVRPTYVDDAPDPDLYWGYKHSAKSDISESALPVTAFDFLVRRIRFTDPLDPEKIQFWHSGRCSRCGRLLTDPESIAAGIGPKCRQRGAHG